jgi:hypothetical protein
MFKFLTGLFALALSAVAIPAPADSLPFEIVDGTVRSVSGATLGVIVPRQGVTPPAGFNMCVRPYVKPNRKILTKPTVRACTAIFL